MLEQASRHRHLGQLERDVPTVADHLSADFDQLFPQRGQRPVCHLLRQGQRPHEVGKVVGQSVKLEPDCIVAELAARQPGPFDSVFAFLDVLLRFAALIVEGHDSLRRSAQVSDDEADAGIQFPRMPLHLGDDPALPVPRACLIAEAGMEATNMIRRATDRTGKQMGDAFLKNRVGFETDGILVVLGFQKLIEVRGGEGGISSEIATQAPFPITLDDGFKDVSPTMSVNPSASSSSR